MDEKYENDPPSEVVGAFNHLWGQIDSAMGTGVVIALIAGAIALIGGVAQACFRSKALRAELERERQLTVQGTPD
ncbi:hypothetical protein [Brevibacterium sp. SMBL_HHYL_HB1]|uniref:hypothetical protein n=1 Tax=Brevibacterium sp. SMBL_HHYL_HB1 TaxID=2777556 RepID=UPI001BA7F39D|nr:hypothetical protein [Brevibacterium sp. SMBL_HHYL_HB1]QUL80656.1 hypothetical protein IG171_07835 [Brevibacterium sp. SMBL_HHYL_HB1]